MEFSSDNLGLFRAKIGETKSHMLTFSILSNLEQTKILNGLCQMMKPKHLISSQLKRWLDCPDSDIENGQHQTPQNSTQWRNKHWKKKGWTPTAKLQVMHQRRSETVQNLEWISSIWLNTASWTYQQSRTMAQTHSQRRRNFPEIVGKKKIEKVF